MLTGGDFHAVMGAIIKDSFFHTNENLCEYVTGSFGCGNVPN